MGWLFPYDAYSKEWLVKDLTKESINHESKIKFSTVKYAVRGNNLWSVIRRENADGTAIQFIVLFKMAFDKDSKTWGYKDIEACCGPYEVDCPIKFLGMVSEECKTSHYPDFEKSVRGRSKRISAEGKIRGQIMYGDIILFKKPLGYRGMASEVEGIKVTYQEKKTLAGYAVDKDGKSVTCHSLLRVPKVDNWEKVVKVVA
jgi:hypothetical protein